MVVRVATTHQGNLTQTRACHHGHMSGDLVAAVKAYRAALGRIETAEKRLTAARSVLPAVRADLHAAIVREYERGARTRELVDATGYTRESIRRILRAGGVEPD